MLQKDLIEKVAAVIREHNSPEMELKAIGEALIKIGDALANVSADDARDIVSNVAIMFGVDLAKDK